MGSSLRAHHLSRRPGLSVLDQCRDALGDGGLGALQAVLGLGAVLLHRRLHLAPALLELALDPVAGLTHSRPGLAASAGAAPVEPVQLALDARADAPQLPLGALARGERLDDLVHPVGHRHRRADGNVDGPLGGPARIGGAAVTGLGQALANRCAVAASASSALGAVGLGAAGGGPGLGVAIG